MYKIGRNDRCWCGSGKKYKSCHEKSDEANMAEFAAKGYPIPDRSLILEPGQIDGIRKSARVSVAIMDALEDFIKEGVTTNEIDALVSKMTAEAGAIPTPLNYCGFPKSCCTSINDVVCHGIPDDTRLKNGDIINVDVTTILDGYYSDMSRMYTIGDISDEAAKLIERTKEMMFAGIDVIKPYMPVAEIGNTIHDIADKYGYGVVRALCGHGVGLKFHSEPTVNHYRSKAKSMILVPGMVLTVEPMINAGTWDVEVLEDEWTVVTRDGSLSAQWEHTVVVTETGVEILTV